MGWVILNSPYERISLMKISKTLAAVASVLFLWACTSDPAGETKLRVMTFNVRINLPSDGPNAWPHRKEKAASMIRFYEPDIFGVQEALKGQVLDLANALPDYAWTGVGRDDGLEQGEYMAVFYRRDRFEVIKNGTFWLSETPEQPGKGWDADWIRTATWVEFKDQGSGQTFFHFNTHLDNRGEVARLEGAGLLLKRIALLAKDQPVIVTGDFNCDPQSPPYQLLTGEVSPLKDSGILSTTPHHGPTRTFTKFDLDALKSTAPPIDFIFVTQDFSVQKHATLSYSFDGFFPSDHFPVLADLSLE
jgi:endonuclease/exonuclease/phosphatase family metal-dependent hydrolase